MRIGGFASGLDIDAMVKELMVAHRKPLDKLNQKKQTVDWQRQKYMEINAKIVDFRNNKLFNYNMNSTFNALKATVSGNTSAVSAKAVGGSTAGTIDIKVNSLATAASVKSSGSIYSSIPEGELEDFKKNIGTKALKDIVGEDLFTKDEEGKPVKLIDPIKINGVEIEVFADDTIQSVINKINNNKEAKVSAFFDPVTGNFAFSSKEQGTINDNGQITLSGALLVDNFKLDNHTAGTDASVEINGITTTRPSNTFMVNGIEITLLAESNGQTSTITTSTDTDKVVDTIKSFIDEYNSLLKMLNDAVGEKKHRDFLPLTSEQKKDMSEDEIKNWEERAQSGLLRNDPILSSALSNLRLSVISSSVKIGEGPKDVISLANLGITTGQWEEKGKLYLSDEAKLREMLESNPNEVVALFTGRGTAEDGSDAGLFQKMYDDLKGTLDAISDKAGTSRFASEPDSSLKDESMLGIQLRNLNRDIDNQGRRLMDLENRYYRQFTAMEVAINKFNTQAGSLMGFFGGQ